MSILAQIKARYQRSITRQRWQWQSLASVIFAVGFVVGTYFTLSSFVKVLLASGYVEANWVIENAGDYILSDESRIEIEEGVARLSVQNYATDSATKLLLHMDESEGEPVDQVGPEGNTTANGVSYATGKLNNAGEFNGENSVVRVDHASGLALSGAHTIEAWVKLDEELSASSSSLRQTIVDKGDYQLYLDQTTGKVNYELASSGVANWTRHAGNDMNGSWDLNGKTHVYANVVDSTNNIYVGLGAAVADAEVWKWDGGSWSQIGGDGKNSSWSDQQFEAVRALVINGNTLYAGLGDTAGDAEVWSCDVATNCTSWTKIGGDGINSSWALNTYEYVSSLVVYDGMVHAGLGVSANDAEVWRWNGTSWSQIGGDSLNSGWTTNFEVVWSMVADEDYLYAGLGLTAGDSEVWRWNGATWTRVGGDGINSSWANSTYEYVFSLHLDDTYLYAGLGVTANDSEVWRCSGCSGGTPSWSQIGGDSLNSGWTTNYEGVYGMTRDASYLYAGLGSTNGDGEVWRHDGDDWEKIGGDGINSSWASAQGDIVSALQVVEGVLYAGVSDTAGNGSYWSWDGSGWTRTGGGGVNNSWGFYGLQSVEVLTSSNGKLYAGTGVSTAGNAMVWEYDEASWRLVGGQGVRDSWGAFSHESVLSMAHYEGNLYVGLGVSSNDGEVWRYDGVSWSQIGGDSLNSGWLTGFEGVYALSVYEGKLFAGLGNSANDAEVWAWDGGSWEKIGGDSLNSGWLTGFENVLSLVVYDGKLHAGLGRSAGDAEVWAWDGGSWAKVGGDGLNSSWNTVYEHVNTLIVYDDELYAGLGITTGEAEIWKWNRTSWVQVGGDNLNSSWADGTFEEVKQMAVYNGELYAGIGTTAGDGEVWKWNGTSWSMIGGDNINSGWGSNVIEYVSALGVHNGKLYVGTGFSANADAVVWSWGDNKVLSSSVTSHQTDWKHVAGSYDGSTMKLYLDGVEVGSRSVAVSMANSGRDLLIGAGYGSAMAGGSSANLAGMIDEVRISNTARTSFQLTTYTTEAQTINPANAALDIGVAEFSGFSATESANGGSITYRLSADEGESWKYYSGGWVSSNSVSEANTAEVINANIASFPVSSEGVIWQAILQGDGNQQVALDEVMIQAEEDLDPPNNPTALVALSDSGGETIESATWYSHESPYFSWSGASDLGSGVAGYYVYFGTTSDAIPETAGTFQAGTTYTGSGLVSGQTYYLRIQTVDVAQNVSAVWSNEFVYRFDKSAPNNPSALVVAPAGYTQTNSYTFNWTDGSDAGSGLAGYQYKTGTPSGQLANWSETTTSKSVTLEGGAYQNDANIFYLRTIDNAGNVSSEMTTNYYFAGDGPSEPQFLNVTPQTNTVNEFAFSWQVPETYSGESSELTYCYTVNTLPSSSSCTFTSPGATSLSASSFATQVGINTFYLVTKNPAELGGAIAYSNYASVTFTANTAAPGIPLNIDVADISIKNSSTWRLTVSWAPPSEIGSGVSSYKILRSSDGESYSEVATTTGSAYVDTSLAQITYYYKVKACDNVNNCGASTAEVSMLPTGKYTEPATLASGPVVSEITTKKATISWVTDRASDSRVQYGIGSGNYYSEEPSSSEQKVSHAIALNNLSPGTTYYYRAKWIDEDGNMGVSEESTFTTSPAPGVKDVTVKKVGLTTATISFTVNGASKVRIYYGLSTAFGGVTEQTTATTESSYEVELSELEDGSKYYYQVNSYDAEDNLYEGTTLFFNTNPRPLISNMRVQQVKGTATSTVLLTWATNTETSTIVTYYPVDNPSATRDKVDLKLVKNHQLVLNDLLPQTQYSVIAKGRDAGGNEAVSEPQRITTATDTRPPVISNVRIEPVVQGVGEEAVAQLVVSWDTDELSTSQVLYGEGSSGPLSNKTQKDESMTYNHLVVVPNLQASKVYHLKVVSEDSAKNEAQSIDQVVITPKSTRSALDLVVSNLSQAFGFLGGIQQ